jgi:hypothetical protein
VAEEIKKIVSQVKRANEDYETYGKEIEKFKKDKVIEAGKIYENKHPELGKKKHLICARLKKDFDGEVDERTVNWACPEEWKQTRFAVVLVMQRCITINRQQSKP